MSVLLVASAVAMPFAWLSSTDLTVPRGRGGETTHETDPSGETGHFGTTRGPPLRVHCPVDGREIEVTPIKSRLHRPLLDGGPGVEKIYTCPVCGYAGTASDWTAARPLHGTERERLSRSLTAWVRESPAARAALIHVGDAGEPTFVRALLAARVASSVAERTRWLEIALTSADGVQLDPVDGARDAVTTESPMDVNDLRAALRVSVLLELGRTADAQGPLASLDRSSPSLAARLRRRFGLDSLPGWW